MSNKQVSIKDLRKVSVIELSKKLRETYVSLVKVNKEMKMKQTKNMNAARLDKKLIARIKTVMGEKAALAKLEKPASQSQRGEKVTK